MERGSLAEQVLQKLRQKRELEQQNRPPIDILKLQALFTRQHNALLKEEYAQLQSKVKQEQQALAIIEGHTQGLDNTSKKQFPRIIIRPAFIASQNVSQKVKEFYTKLANTFLRVQILRSRHYQESEGQESKFMKEISQLGQLEKQVRKKEDQIMKITNAKRLKVLKQTLRLKQLNRNIESLQVDIKRDRQERLELVQQYQLKKVNLGYRLQRLKQVEKEIQKCKDKIEELYNPRVYRQHLRTVFQFQTKNQMLLKSLADVRRRVKTLEIQTQNEEKSLGKNQLAGNIGRIPLGMGPKRKGKNTHCHTFSSSLSKIPTKIQSSSKNTISVYYSQTEPFDKPKDVQKSKDLSIKDQTRCSPFGSMGSTDLVSFPRYRSAFTKRLTNC